ncbi:dihydrolipoyllysine-residue acetyltransferase [Litoribrevibacter albus]|uniref:Acetyltransferase component of pyruvate dehydrogenase complex n=1 Tax=Litoribrevibacter albus TaxID=1473156 RepID=A0AA37SDT5_9GAMM|nr:dihydrolipoyllysine-residue acetyltransferase [Litoribrevibacter albus]GLQ33323.1 acetyltransferase component of pyruvate dehydrogenase complex [Litoribrevibacter albus]
MDEIKVPDLGGFEGVEVIEISVSPGDVVEQDDAIIVVETDKATMEIPAPKAGKILELKVKEGDKVSEGDLVATMESAGASESQIQADTVAQSETSPESSPAKQPVQADTSSESSSKAQPATSEQTLTSEQTVISEQAVKVPDLGGFSGVEVIEVSVSVGQQVDEEDTLLVLETDKATMEIPAPMAGEVLSIQVSVGDKVNEGDTIAVLKGTAIIEGSDKVSTVSQTMSASESEEKVKVQTVSADSSKDKEPQSVSQRLNAINNGNAGGSGKTSEKVYAGPAVRKLAREFGVSLDDVVGTTGASGPRSRILQEDVQNYVKHRLNEAPTSPQGGMGIEPIPEVDFSRFGNVRQEPLSRIQKISSQHLHRCWLNIPHVTQFDEIDITELEDFRKSVNAQGTYDTKLTLVPFLVKAVQKVLMEMPRFNASLAPDGESLIVKEFYNIGVAVDTDQGLMVPVVKNVDTKSVLNIAADCMQYAQQARAGKLKPDALQGSCFSISSLGGIGGTQFTPIVNAPEVAILGVSKAAIKPIWQEGEWQPRLILPVALSYDHRVIDGVLAAKFTTRLKQLLEDSRHLLL